VVGAAVGHAGGAGWDEILLVALPVAVFGFVLWWSEVRARRRPVDDAAEFGDRPPVDDGDAGNVGDP
jgi:hypothetical protein